MHDLLHDVVEGHRWLGSREIGRLVTGAANLGFLGLVVLGVCLWWPRRWTRGAIRPVTLFDSRLRGRARDFNWHNVIGTWCAPVLLVLTLTGVVMSYQWANDLLYRLSGSEPPPTERSALTTATGRGERPAGLCLGALASPDRPAKKCQQTDTARHPWSGSSASRPFTPAS